MHEQLHTRTIPSRRRARDSSAAPAHLGLGQAHQPNGVRLVHVPRLAGARHVDACVGVFVLRVHVDVLGRGRLNTNSDESVRLGGGKVDWASIALPGEW